MSKVAKKNVCTELQAACHIQPLEIKVECEPAITVEDIEELKKRIPMGHDCNRLLLQQGSVLITKKPPWVWKHAEIRFIGKEFSALLHAGQKTNKFACLLDGNDIPRDYCLRNGWRLWLRDQMVIIFEFLANNADTLVGIARDITPAIKHKK